MPGESGSGMWMNTGEIENFGVEFVGNYRITPSLNVTANYSYLHMKHEVVSSPEHKFYAGVDYSIKKWYFSTGFQYVHNLLL